MKMEDLVNYCKQYGFVFQDSEIYGGLANSWDYGPLGRELKNNIKNAWWQRFIQQNTDLRRFLALRDLTIIQFFMGTGVRCEELVDLTLDDLHLEEDRPYVSVLGKGHYEEEEKRKEEENLVG